MLGGNNGQASAINSLGQIVGFAENGTVDSSCAPGTTNNRIQLPVLREKGRAHALPTGSNPDRNALWINDQGQAVGDTGNDGIWSARKTRLLAFLTSSYRSKSYMVSDQRAFTRGRSPLAKRRV